MRSAHASLSCVRISRRSRGARGPTPPPAPARSQAHLHVPVPRVDPERKLEVLDRVLVAAKDGRLGRQRPQNRVEDVVHVLRAALEEAPAAADKERVARKERARASKTARASSRRRRSPALRSRPVHMKEHVPARVAGGGEDVNLCRAKPDARAVRRWRVGVRHGLLLACNDAQFGHCVAQGWDAAGVIEVVVRHECRSQLWPVLHLPEHRTVESPPIAADPRLLDPGCTARLGTGSSELVELDLQVLDVRETASSVARIYNRCAAC